MRVLIVDGEPSIRKTTAVALEGMGHVVEQAACGKAAFRLLEASRFEIVLLDLKLEESLGPLTPRQQDMLATARDDAERLLRILNDLLDLARLDVGGAALRREIVEPGPLFHETISQLAETASAAGMSLMAEIEPDLPRVSVDAPRIQHVFANLVGNAVKHSPSGGQIIARAARTADGDIRFSVKDDGPGIAPEYHQRIFDRFFRVPGQGRVGAGLGLSIAREIVLAHGGYLGVRSQPGHGAEFYFTLPARKVESPARA